MSDKATKWAVEADLWSGKPSVLLGVGWFGWPNEAHLRGCTTALFPTRREARKAARYAADAGDIAARAVPVELTIKRK